MRLIAHNDGRELRGNERQLLLLARGLCERGHDVLVSCRANAPLQRALENAHVAATPIRPRGDLALPSAFEFRRLVRERRPDAVLLTSWKRLFVGSWAARGSGGGARLVARLGIVRRMPGAGTASFKLRRAFGRVDTLVVNSEAVARAWLDGAPWFDAQRVRVIRNAVASSVGDPAKLRRELGLAHEVRLIAAVAALEPRKGIDLLLRALAALPTDVHAVVAGDGPDAERLRALARSLAVDERVHWLGVRSDVADVLAASAAFVLPTRQDSVANALLEAMAAGVPAVTTAGNGAEEALGAVGGRGPAGWIVPGEDPAGLAAAATEALGGAPSGGATSLEARVADARGVHPRGVHARVAEARWRALHWFGVERMVAEYEQVLFA